MRGIKSIFFIVGMSIALLILFLVLFIDFSQIRSLVIPLSSTGELPSGLNQVMDNINLFILFFDLFFIFVIFSFKYPNKIIKSLDGLCKNHFRIIVTALFVSLLFGLPHIIIPRLSDAPYAPLVVEGVSSLTFEETHQYATAVRDVLDGHLTSADPFTFEHKDKPYLREFLPLVLLAFLSYLVGSISSMVILADFLFPPLIFLLIYYLLFTLTKDRHISLLGGLSFVICQSLIMALLNLRPVYLLGLLLNYGDGITFLYYSRMPTQLNLVFLISAIFLLYLAVKHKLFFLSFLSGVFFGLLFYVYVYFGVFVLAGLGVYLLFSLLRKEWLRSKLIILNLLVGASMSIPFFINLFNFSQLPQVHDILIRYSSNYTLGSTALIYPAVFLLLFVILYPKKNENYYFLVSFLIAGILCRNANLILGINMPMPAWEQKVLVVWIMIMLPVFVSALFFTKQRSQKSHINYKLFIGLMITAIFLFGFYVQLRASFNNYSQYTLSEETIDLFNWIDSNTDTDSVILASPVTSLLIPAYTHNNIFLPHSLSHASNGELIERLIITYKFFNKSTDDFKKFFDKPIGIGQGYLAQFTTGNIYLFGNTYPSGPDTSPGKPEIPADILNDMIYKYENYPYDLPIALKRYRLDYVLYGPKEEDLSDVDINSYPFLRLVYENKEFKVYRFVNRS